MTADLIARTEAYARRTMEGDASGHDWWHVDRVRRLAVRLAGEEDADARIVELAALLHDIADYKVTGDEDSGWRTATAWLQECQADPATVEAVAAVVRDLSFKGAGVAEPQLSLEGLCVRDADRLDAMGAIGIARAFAYGGHAGRSMHEPGAEPELHASVEAYRSARGTTVNHFAEKLLLLRDRMGTAAGRRIAEGRHRVMEQFLADFHREWDATDGDGYFASEGRFSGHR